MLYYQTVRYWLWDLKFLLVLKHLKDILTSVNVTLLLVFFLYNIANNTCKLLSPHSKWDKLIVSSFQCTTDNKVYKNGYSKKSMKIKKLSLIKPSLSQFPTFLELGFLKMT